MSNFTTHHHQQQQQQESIPNQRFLLRHFFDRQENDISGSSSQRQQQRRRKSSSASYGSDREVSIIDQLNENKTDYTELQLSSVHANLYDIDDLLTAIEKNCTVRVVRIHGFFVDKLPSARLQTRFWDAIGKLPSLEHLHLSYFLETGGGGGGGLLMASTLKFVLTRATKLIKLSIHDTKLCIGQNRKINLNNHPSLHSITFSQLQLVLLPQQQQQQQQQQQGCPTGTSSSSLLDPLLSMCITAPNLRKLIIRLAAQQPQQQQPADLLTIMTTTPTTLQRLAEKTKTTLKTLELRRVVFDNQGMSHFMKLLTNNNNNNNSKQSSSPSSSLKELAIECNEPLIQESTCIAIGELLRNKHTTLEKLELWGGSRIDESGTIYILESLETNRSLKVLHMSQIDIVNSHRKRQAFIDLLRYHNYFLESIVVPRPASTTTTITTTTTSNNNNTAADDDDSDAAAAAAADNDNENQQPIIMESFLKTMDFYLRMNGTQIRRLLLNVNVNREQILDKILLHSSESNLDYVFHLLRGNPHLLHHY